MKRKIQKEIKNLIRHPVLFTEWVKKQKSFGESRSCTSCPLTDFLNKTFNKNRKEKIPISLLEKEFEFEISYKQSWRKTTIYIAPLPLWCVRYLQIADKEEKLSESKIISILKQIPKPRSITKKYKGKNILT